MANLKFNGDIYYKERKQEFFEQFKETTQNTLKSLFKKTYEYEYKLKKDLCEFNLDEIDQILIDSDNGSVRFISTTLAYIKNYIDWAIKNEYARQLNSPFQYINVAKYATKFEKEDSLLTLIEIEDIESRCINFQDSVIVRLLYEGVSGKEYSELINLSINDVNRQTRTLKLIDLDGSSRYIEVSEQCINLILEASKEVKYIRVGNNRNPFLNLLESDKVLKLSNTKTDDAVADANLIYRRIRSISEKLGRKISPSLITQSGMLKLFYELTVISNMLPKEAIKVVYLRYNIIKGIEDDKNETAMMYKVGANLLNEKNLHVTYDKKRKSKSQ